MNLSHPDKRKFELPYATLYIGGGITILIVAAFVVIAKNSQIDFEIRDLVAILTCGIVSTTLIYHAKNLRLNYEANQAKLTFDVQKFEEEKKLKIDESRTKKVQYTFEVNALWFTPEMAKNVEISRGFILRNKDELMKGDIYAIVKKLDEDLETRKSVVCVLNYFEHLALMIKEEIVDEMSVKNYFKTVFLDYFKVLRRYIEELQKTSSRYLVNYEQIAKRWESS